MAKRLSLQVVAPPQRKAASVVPASQMVLVVGQTYRLEIMSRELVMDARYAGGTSLFSEGGFTFDTSEGRKFVRTSDLLPGGTPDLLIACI